MWEPRHPPPRVVCQLISQLADVYIGRLPFTTRHCIEYARRTYYNHHYHNSCQNSLILNSPTPLVVKPHGVVIPEGKRKMGLESHKLCSALPTLMPELTHSQLSHTSKWVVISPPPEGERKMGLESHTSVTHARTHSLSTLPHL